MACDCVALEWPPAVPGLSAFPLGASCCVTTVPVTLAPTPCPRRYVKGVISDLLMNKLDLSLLVISKARRVAAVGGGGWASGVGV